MVEYGLRRRTKKDRGKGAPDPEPSAQDSRTDSGPETPHAEPSPNDPPPVPSPGPEASPLSGENTQSQAAPDPEPPPATREPFPPSEPAAAPASAPTLFERLAEQLSQAEHAPGSGLTVAEAACLSGPRPPPSRDGVPLAPWEVPPPDRAAPGSSFTPFDRLARELVRDAKDAAPLVEGLAAREAEPEAFARVVQARNQALRDAGGGGLFISAGLAWMAGRISPHSDPLPPGWALTSFERNVRDANQALRANGGEPHTTDGESFWERAVARLMEAGRPHGGLDQGHGAGLCRTPARGARTGFQQPRTGEVTYGGRYSQADSPGNSERSRPAPRPHPARRGRRRFCGTLRAPPRHMRPTSRSKMRCAPRNGAALSSGSGLAYYFDYAHITVPVFEFESGEAIYFAGVATPWSSKAATWAA